MTHRFSSVFPCTRGGQHMQTDTQIKMMASPIAPATAETTKRKKEERNIESK